MMKMGYMSKNFYEMRYTVSQAAADGSGTATDLSPNCSFFLDISPEEAFESIKVKMGQILAVGKILPKLYFFELSLKPLKNP